MKNILYVCARAINVCAKDRYPYRKNTKYPTGRK